MTGSEQPSPLVSAIIPTFNAAEYVSQAVNSVLATRGVSVEVIVIDDQSTDATWQMLERFGGAIRKVRQQKGGPYKARNLGARLASGQWLAFLDADDEWLPEKLARQLAAADDDAALIFTDCENFGACDRVKARQSDTTEFFDGEVFEQLLLGNFISMSSVLIRRDWFERLGGFSEEHTGVQDWDLWLRYTAAGGQVKVIRDALTRYRIHAGQMTQNLDLRAAERLAVLERALSSSRGQRVSRETTRRARASVWEIGAWLAAPQHRAKAIGWYLRAARHWPWNLRLYKGVVKCCLNWD
jgi:glycosyltransferase involved in cell wall biosynthesis